jgi:RNA polymerase sigma-70 factor, ECF subfamily
MEPNGEDAPAGDERHGRGAVHSPSTDDDYARLRSDLARVVAGICPRWMASRQEDLVQAVLMRVMAVQRQREGSAELSSFYLRKAAHSALVDELRRWRRRQEVPLGEDNAASMAMAEGPDPERLAAGRQLGDAIRDCLKTLVRPRRVATVLHLQGHSVPEVAHLLQWSDKRAENLVYRGLADLRGCLERKQLAP